MHLIKEKRWSEYGAKREKDENFFFVERKSRRVMNGVKMNLTKNFNKSILMLN